MALSYFTSDTLIADVKRRAMIPTANNTFAENDFLAFANDELAIGVVPSILQVHEEYFVHSESVDLVASQSNYAIPYRAIGGKLRDLFYQDTNGNLREMSRVPEENISYYQNSTLSSNFVYFYVKGNDIVLLPSVGTSVTGSIVFSYYLRPNQLVDEDRVATVASYTETTPTGSITAISTADPCVITSASHGLYTGALVAITSSNSTPTINNSYAITVIDANTFSIPDDTVTVAGTSGTWTAALTTLTVDQIPTGYTTVLDYDFMQAKSGHRTICFDVSPLNINSVNLTIIFNTSVIPSSYTIESGDYVAFAGECIIPQIPDELHSVLSQRVALRCLDALGDQLGIQSGNLKLAEMEKKTETLIDTRVDGAVIKVNNLRGLLGGRRKGRI